MSLNLPYRVTFCNFCSRMCKFTYFDLHPGPEKSMGLTQKKQKLPEIPEQPKQKEQSN